jgi:hypothetical protein
MKHIFKIQYLLHLGKGKIVPTLNQVPRHEDVGGSGGIASRIRNLDARWRTVISFTPRPLQPRMRERDEIQLEKLR